MLLILSKLLKLFAKLKNFFDRRYWLLLVIIVAVSYGQILFMQPWEDDNALFFKLAHIEDAVGYFGKGPLGEGIYRFAAVPFIPIYKLFHFYIPAYFALLLFLYALTTIVVYKVFSKVLGEAGGRIAGFIYAAGYITSDSFWRMANSATTSISIMMVALFFYFYWRYYKEGKIRSYFFALAVFLIAVVYSVVRNHYLFAIVVFFEVIFLALKKPIKSIVFSIVRIIPFLFIFYRWVILAGDSRTEGVADYIKSILQGNFYQTYGVLSSVANLFVPDYITNFVFGKLGGGIFSIFALFLTACLAIFFVFRNFEKSKYWIPIFWFTLAAWSFFARDTFTVPIISPGYRQIFTVTLGGIIAIVFLAKLITLGNKGKLFLLLGLWLLVNALAYSTYYPTLAYDTINRYLAHSFFAYSGILGFLWVDSVKQKKQISFATVLIICLGLLNIFNAVKYQNSVLLNRSFPVKKFYDQLSVLLPKLEKGDVLYFDISSSVKGYYRDAISAAMMPDTASFAWRYGIDRYDFELVTDFNDIKNPDKVHSYWYSSNGLIDTTSEVRNYFLKEKQVSVLNSKSVQIASSTPTRVRTTLIAVPPVFDDAVLSQTFPKYDSQKIKNALEYKSLVENFRNNSFFEVTSFWQDRILKNLYDGDADTVWQPDRVLWKDKMENLKVKLPEVWEVDRVILQTGSFKDSLLTSYEISASLDGIKWTRVETKSSIELRGKHVVRFVPVKARYVKADFMSTLGDEAPMIAEFFVIPTKFSDIDIDEAEAFLQNPLNYVADREGFNLVLSSLNYRGKVKVRWMGNKEEIWQEDKDVKLDVIYDGVPRSYSFVIPAGGTVINSIEFVNESLPGRITVK